MTNKNYCLRRVFLYFLLIFFTIGYTGFIYVSGISYGRKIQNYLNLPLNAWEKTTFIKTILDGSEKKTDCQLELFLNLDVIAYSDSIDSVPKWREIFFSNKIKKHLVYNEQILELLRKYREQYPLDKEYFIPCQEDLNADVYRIRVEEAWNFIMNGK